MVAILDNKWAKIASSMNNRPPAHVMSRYRKTLLKKKTVIAAVVARSRAPSVPAPALASGVFDPLDVALVEWCAELEAPIGLPSYATNSDSDSSSDNESAQLLSFLSREAEIAELPAPSTGLSACPFGASFGAGT
jgi:hypothetical protein